MSKNYLRWTALILIAIMAVIALVFLPHSKVKKNYPPNNDPWIMVSYKPDTQYGTYLGNGYISTRIMGDGVGSQFGKPLSCFMAGLYDDEKIITTPTWSDLRFYDGKQQFKIDKDADYKQTLDMRTGIFTTYATWRAGDKTFKGSIQIIVSRAQPSSALIKADFVPDFDGELRVECLFCNTTDRLKVSLVDKSNPLMFAESYTTRQSGINLGIASYMFIRFSDSITFPNGDKNGLHCVIEANKGKSLSVSNYVALSKGNSPKAAVEAANSELKAAMNAREKFVTSHKEAWAKLWQHDIVVDGPKKDQQALHSCMFYLLESVREGSQWSIPPMGLSDAAFSGHVFWDADLWMFPALILQHPELARSIVDYRYNTLQGAIANAKSDGYDGAQYAWESGYTGKEDTPGGLVYKDERHVNGDIALAQWQYFLATGDTNWLKTRGYPVIKATADYWVSRTKYNKAKKRYEILQVVPPDENADEVNNSAYTNCLVKTNLQIALNAAKISGNMPNKKWAEISNKIYIPLDKKNKRFIAFDNYKGLPAKQADSELIIYPLQFNIAGENMNNIYKNTFDFYAPKVLKNGPAMISSVHSVISARLGLCDKAYTELEKSYLQYLRGDFNYFNEKRSIMYVNMCFLTGAAGPVQATIFGIAGANINYFPINPLKNELYFKPCLPKQWKSLKITGVEWQKKTFDVVIQNNKAVVIKK